jgi:hypothetical protein
MMARTEQQTWYLSTRPDPQAGVGVQGPFDGRPGITNDGVQRRSGGYLPGMSLCKT